MNIKMNLFRRIFLEELFLEELFKNIFNLIFY